MRTTIPAAALAAVLSLTLTACGDDYDADLVDALKAQGASQEEAECFIDELGEDDAQGFLDNIDAQSAPDNADEILAALDECGVEPDGPEPEPEGASDGEETPEPSPGAETSATGGSGEADIDAIADCLESAGFDVDASAGPPPQIFLVGESGSGGLFYYDDQAQASDASAQFVDSFGGGDGDLVTGASGNVAYYYRNSNDEASQLEGCLT